MLKCMKILYSLPLLFILPDAVSVYSFTGWDCFVEPLLLHRSLEKFQHSLSDSHTRKPPKYNIYILEIDTAYVDVSIGQKCASLRMYCKRCIGVNYYHVFNIWLMVQLLSKSWP